MLQSTPKELETPIHITFRIKMLQIFTQPLTFRSSDMCITVMNPVEEYCCSKYFHRDVKHLHFQILNRIFERQGLTIVRQIYLYIHHMTCLYNQRTNILFIYEFCWIIDLFVMLEVISEFLLLFLRVESLSYLKRKRNKYQWRVVFSVYTKQRILSFP